MFNSRILIPVPILAMTSRYMVGHGSAYSSTASMHSVSQAAGIPLMEHSMLYLFSFAVSFVAIFLLNRIADKLGLVDMPDGVRKIHVDPKPLVGGLGMFFSITASVLLFLPAGHFSGLLYGILILAITGLIDDRQGLGFKPRLVAQMLAVFAIMHFDGVSLSTFGNLIGTGSIKTFNFASAVTIFCVVGVINAMNMMDGLDGLAGSVALVACTSFAILGLLNGQSGLVFISVVYVGAIVAFLRFNWYPSKLFMGDTGSMILGFSLAYFALQTTQGSSLASPSAALLVLALPISDTIVVMIKRILKGKSPFHADKTHFHHVLKSIGLDHRAAVIVITFFCALSSLIAIMGTINDWSDSVFFVIFLFGFLSYFIASYRVKRIYRILLWFRRQNILPVELERQ